MACSWYGAKSLALVARCVNVSRPNRTGAKLISTCLAIARLEQSMLAVLVGIAPGGYARDVAR